MGKVVAAIVMVFWAGCVWAQAVTIAALGDSLTQGYGLPVEDGFVPQLEGWLTAAGHDVRVINAGVSGDTTAGGLSRAAWTLTPDVDAMIVALGGNDLLRGIDPEVSRANLGGILQAADAANVPVLLIGMQAPGNYGPEYKAAFDGMYPELAAEFGTLYLDSFFAGLGSVGTDPADVRQYMQADGVHPNATGVARIVEGVGPLAVELIAVAK
ncbi:arylesterase [uncultured Tateyamaria sp.]|uniref:arylesterase n=1 Tax=uncultured Tateyamaria sp. TaxID=455651 RepID=UPI00261D2479|nr:arylesterase [uncultured Tateyamaria sp.]